MKSLLALVFAAALVGCNSGSKAPSVVSLPQGLASPETASREKPTPAVQRETTRPTTRPIGGTPGIPHLLVAPSILTPTPDPSEPPPHEGSETLGYRVDGNAIEVAGVCRFSESDATCWDAQGRMSDLITANIRPALTDKDRLGRVTMEHGKKNRIVVVRNEQAPANRRSGREQTLSVESYGAPDHKHGNGSIVDLRSESPFPVPDKPFVTYRAFAVAEEERATETQMRILVSKPMPNPVDLPLTKGASVHYGGCRFAVTAVGKRDPSKGGFFGGSPDEVWTIKVSRSGEPSRRTMFSVRNAPGAEYVDVAGKVVGNKPYQPYWNARSEEYRRTGKPFDVSAFPFKRILLTGLAFPHQTEFEVTTNVDPRRIGKVRLLGTTERTVDVTGIPLDPQ